jgi:hypothetical protein
LGNNAGILQLVSWNFMTGFLGTLFNLPFTTLNTLRLLVAVAEGGIGARVVAQADF